MPVDAHIFATLDSPIEKERLATLRSHLSEAVGETCSLSFDIGEEVISQIPATENQFLPDGLPETVGIYQVELNSPYYGPDYERGYWPQIAAVLEFLRRRLPEAKVWYGRDDGDWVKQVTDESLNAMWDHWAENGGRPYYKR